jgi:hypothetical protein
MTIPRLDYLMDARGALCSQVPFTACAGRARSDVPPTRRSGVAAEGGVLCTINRWAYAGAASAFQQSGVP